MSTKADNAEERRFSSFPITLGFVPLSASAGTGESAKSGPAPYVQMRLRLAERHSIRTSDKRELGELEWNVEISRQPSGSSADARAYERHALGLATHHPPIPFRADDFFDCSAPESFGLSLQVDAGLFQELWSLVLSGRLPMWISVGIQELELGWEPDGSGIEWDVTSSPVKPITELHIRFASEVGAKDSNLEEEVDEWGENVKSWDAPIARGDLRDVFQALTARAEETRKRVESALAVCVGLLASLLAVALFR